MEQIKIFKALSNETRISILQWLKNPNENFEEQLHTGVLSDFPGGVCVNSIKKRTGLSQSTVSKFMSVLEEADLVESRKIDQYTYFRRNEKKVNEISKWIQESL